MAKVELVAPMFLQPGNGRVLSKIEKSEIKKSLHDNNCNGNYNLNKSIEGLLIRLNSASRYDDIPDIIKLSYNNLIERNVDFKETLDLLNLTAKIAALRLNEKPKEIIFTGFGTSTIDSESHKKLVKAGFLGGTSTPMMYGIEAAREDNYRIQKHRDYWSSLIVPDKKITVADTKPVEIQLTFRQEQIANLIRDRGLTNKQIAKMLGLSESTVKLHIGIVLKKYGIRNRVQLVNNLD